MDLSIHGKPTPQYDRTGSAKAKNTSANKQSSYYTPETARSGFGRMPPPGAVVTQAELEAYRRYYEGSGDQTHDPRLASRETHDRPDCVPALNLGKLVHPDNLLTNPLPYSEGKLDTPNTASTVSWGTSRGDMYNQQGRVKDDNQGRRTAMNSPFALHYTPSPLPSQRQQQEKKPKEWYEPAVPENLPPPSQRYKQQYQDYQEDMKQSYRQFVQGQGDGHRPGAQPNNDHPRGTQQHYQQPGNTESDPEVPEDNAYNYSWRPSQPQFANPLKKDAEELAAEKRKHQLVETVMVDQLSRAVISDPEQNHRNYSRCPVLMEEDIRTLHESKIRTTGTATENLLSKRLMFGARILTRNGRDAHRELCGFYFMHDNTLTIYEYKQFGKKSSALPFIQRGCYKHVTGRRRGSLYVIQDIFTGSNLTFSTSDQNSIPQTLRQQQVIIIRVAEVDERAKANFVFDGHIPMDPDEYQAGMQPPFTRQEYEDYKFMSDIQGEVRKQLKKRGIRTLTGMGQHFRKIDQSGDGLLNRSELQKALKTYHIDIDEKKFDSLWKILDQNGDNKIDYGEFLRGVIGEMSEFRKQLVRKVGNAREVDVLNNLLDSFEHCKSSGEISYIDFEDYYEGLSLGIDDDELFTMMMKNCWGI
uniref:LOW QUALITY PROTEIN: calcyphosin-2-like n=1 Tax=Saccoglossus kowalevskii TaxID=10224 RepID=A0ABM0M519_SACKO|nr:PREDICTED: LOW QUALITY PROTEIN: calcyphosin-2-like [Saccoglossus kowalevskii]